MSREGFLSMFYRKGGPHARQVSPERPAYGRAYIFFITLIATAVSPTPSIMKAVPD